MSSNARYGGQVKCNETSNEHSYGMDSILLMASLLFFILVALFISVMYVYVTKYRRRGFFGSGRQFYFSGDDLLRLQSVGLDAAAIQAVPVFEFQSVCFRDGLQCAVCLCEFKENERGRVLPKCKHSFHIECIDMWFYSHSTCPLCRTRVQSEPPSKAVGSSHVGETSSRNFVAEEPIALNVTEMDTNLVGQQLEEGQTSSGAVVEPNPTKELCLENHGRINKMEQGSSSANDRLLAKLSLTCT
eukprot:Gb_04647 [translate_table: standard]